MLDGNGIVSRLEGRNGVIPGSVRARHEMRVALDIGYGDLRVGNHRSRRIKNHARDAAGADLSESAWPRQNEQREAEDDTGKGPETEHFLVFVHSSPLE